jgi:SAM-dependent methyltransferase
MSVAGWQRLWRHSYRVGFAWLAKGMRHGWKGARVGLCRLLVPLDPWRYYELGRVAEADFSGRVLDISSPKLLMSLLVHEGRGTWLGIDLMRREIERWRHVDPKLDLEVADCTRLPYPDASFDHAVCVSVIEHLAGEADTVAMAEIWRVLRPGGEFHLTTNVAPQSRDLWRDDPIYEEASTVVGGRVFFERHYTPADLRQRLLHLPWQVVVEEYAQEIDRRFPDRFERWRPWSYLWGGLLRARCPSNFKTSPSAEILEPDRHGVVYLHLTKPPSAPTSSGSSRSAAPTSASPAT